MAKLLNSFSGMPQVDDALLGWENLISLVRIVSNVDVYGAVTSTKTTVSFRGVIQPLSVDALLLKPESQRGYAWLQIHTPKNTTVPLAVGDEIEIDSIIYRVSAKLDYSRNGFIEYHIVDRLANA
jgi:hypothetical protein